MGKQRVEAYQILKALSDPLYGWQKHPAVLMWKGYEYCLCQYMNECIDEWERRGYENNMFKYPMPKRVWTPWWFGLDKFHDSHKATLLRKNPTWYKKFGWSVRSTLELYWPTDNVATEEVIHEQRKRSNRKRRTYKQFQFD